MSELVNSMRVTPVELREGGKVMAVTVTCHVIKRGGGCYYRLYCGAYLPDEYGGIPQGARVGGDVEAIVQQLFPVIMWSDIEPDEF